MARTITANREARVELQHNPHQLAFLKALDAKTLSGRHAFHRLALFAGRRGGKTRIGAIAAAKKMQIPRSWGWICAPTYPDLHDFVIPEIFKTIPEAWIGNWSESHLELELKNYAKVQFRSLEDPDKARGPGLDWAWIDETRKVQELAWNTMLPALTDKGGQAWFTTSPNGFDWCYETFWRPAMLKEPGYWAVKYKTAENPIYKTKAGQAELADAKRRMDETFYQQEFEADFVTFTGAIYGATINPLILRTDDEIRSVLPEWPYINPHRVCYVGMDPGADHPFSVVIGIMGTRGLVMCGEYEGRNKPVSEHKRDIRGVLHHLCPSHPFEPQTWAIDKSQRQFAIELAQAPDQIFATAAENDVLNGIRRVQEWIASKNIWFIDHPERPGMSVARLIEQLRGYRWAENKTPDGQARLEKVIKRKDDLPDGLRYLLMAGPELPDAPAADGRRDLSTLAPDDARSLERLRKYERPREESDEEYLEDGEFEGGLLDSSDNPMGDFWA